MALSIEGSVDLDLFGLVLATGTFEMTQQDGVVINDGNGINLTNASLMTVSLSNLNLFVGVGASLDENGSPDDISDDFINTGSAIGFTVAGASLDMAIVKEDPLFGVRSWTGLSAHVNGMGIVGLPDAFELNVRELDLLLNIPAADTTKINWAGVAQVSGTQLINLPNTIDFKVGGSLDLNISGFVLAAGTFEISKESGLTINDGVNPILTNATLMAINLSDVYLFVGANGDFARDGDGIVTGFDFGDGTVGFHVTGARLNLAIIGEDPTVATPRSWMGISAHIDAMDIVGLPLELRAEHPLPGSALQRRQQRSPAHCPLNQAQLGRPDQRRCGGRVCRTGQHPGPEGQRPAGPEHQRFRPGRRRLRDHPAVRADHRRQRHPRAGNQPYQRLPADGQHLRGLPVCGSERRLCPRQRWDCHRI